ncbi:MAG: PEP/pyruvate-binding domain-containing protein, partial [Abiotrophia defectiva]
MKQVYDLQKVGGKAYHLMEMTKAGLPVPSFAVFAFDCFDRVDSMDFLASQEAAYQAGDLSLEQLSQELLAWAKESFAKEDLSPVLSWAKQTFPSGQVRLAVRSSASIEDGAVSSFAGQFESQLDIPIDHLPQSLEHTFLSLYQVSALAYLFKQGISLPEAQMNCLVQVMIKGDLSGVYFTANPKGILNEHIVVVGQGLGDQIVEDKVPTSMVTYHPADQLSYTEQEPGAPSLTTSQLGELESLAQQAVALFGPYLDLEFTFQGDRLYILQARPITTLPQGNQIILDNSNIVESYPGLSTP